MLIREMKLEDIPQVVEIEKACFSVPWSEKSFEDSICRKDTIFLISEEMQETLSPENKIICIDHSNPVITGYIGMYFSFEEANVTNVAVHPSYWKSGYGKELVSAAISKAKQKQIEKIFLEVRVSNEPAISLYQKKGFENLGIRKNFYDHPKEDAYIMCCDIASYEP